MIILKKNIKFLKIITFMSFLIAILFSFTYLLYLQESYELNQKIEQEIKKVANGIPLILPENFHDNYSIKSKIDEKIYFQNVLKLSYIANNFNVTYIYTMVEENGKIYFTSSSATKEEIKNKTFIKFKDLYEEASPAVYETFKTGKIKFVEESDRLGTFKTVMIPQKTKNGKIFITGVDIKISEIKENLIKRAFYHFIYYFILIMVIALPIFYNRIQYIKKIAHFDILTGLPNRIEFQNKTLFAIALAKRKNEPLSILFLDLDGFKEINDTFGHEMGDNLLKEVSKRILDNIRETDIPSRQGGDEFLITLPNTGKEGSEIIAQKIINEIGKPYFINNKELNVTFSIGISNFPADDEDFKSLCKKADIAMYKSKFAGKNQFSFYDNK
jgi:diguanylate cyclase (GGDEF)-like protein